MILGDVDMVSNFGGATYSPLNSNGRFALNSVAFLVGDTANGAVPEPATWAMMMFGFGGMGYAMRRKSKVSARIRFA